MDQQPHAHAIAGSPECLLCPLCVLLQALTASKPEVTRHVIAAGRELSLALSAVLESQQEAAEEADQRLRRINID